MKNEVKLMICGGVVLVYSVVQIVNAISNLKEADAIWQGMFYEGLSKKEKKIFKKKFYELLNQSKKEAAK